MASINHKMARLRLRILTFSFFPLVVTLWSDSVLAESFRVDEPQPPTFVLIIDDMGLHWERGLQALALPGPITYAFLPYRKHAKSLAHYAHRLNKEIMLHMPMSNVRRMPLGEGALTAYQDERTLKSRLRSALASIPFVRGMNNHMGSQLTSQQTAMRWVMEVLQEEGLYFVDSRTTAKSVALTQAQSASIPAFARDVFLDHERDPALIHEQFKRAVRTAEEYGSVVVIGHPYPETIDYLHSALPKLSYLGISQATVSGMLNISLSDVPITEFYQRRPLAIDPRPLEALNNLVEDIRSTPTYTSPEMQVKQALN